jgi:transcriptional regulator of acetoin/glycerol metabolism
LAIIRAVALAEGNRIGPADLPEEVRAAPRGPAGGQPRSLAAIEREHILSALARNGGNRLKTAAELGVGSATLYRKLKQYESQR